MRLYTVKIDLTRSLQHSTAALLGHLQVVVRLVGSKKVSTTILWLSVLIYKVGLKASPTVFKADQGHRVYRTKVVLAAFNGHPKDLPPAGLNCRSDSIKHISPAFSFHARGDVWSCHPSNSQPVEGIKHESLHCLYIPWSTFHRV